jgi:SOS-response transcriptional repressor LexA
MKTAQRRAPRELGYRGVQVLAYVRETIANDGQAPSYGMICNELGINTKGEVSQIVAALERRALVARVGDGRVRRIRLHG